MPEKFYERVEDRLSVEIWSAKECNTDEHFTMARYDSDIEPIVKALTNDPDFMTIFLSVKSPEDLKKIVEVILCYDLRLTTRKYGLEH